MGKEENSRQREKHRQSPGSGGSTARARHGKTAVRLGRSLGSSRWQVGLERQVCLDLCGLVKNVLCSLSERL